MSKLKIAGIIIAVMAASVFVFLYFVRPHTVINAILEVYRNKKESTTYGCADMGCYK